MEKVTEATLNLAKCSLSLEGSTENALKGKWPNRKWPSCKGKWPRWKI